MAPLCIPPGMLSVKEVLLPLFAHFSPVRMLDSLHSSCMASRR